jgi:hypothetical protein
MISVLLLGVPMALITGITIVALTDKQIPQRELRRLAEERGMTLLRSWLTPEQTEQFDLVHEFDVIGCDTGTHYRITYGTQLNVIQLDKTGRYASRLCFAPDGGLVTGDIMLAQKIALETMEGRALAVANTQCAVR